MTTAAKYGAQDLNGNPFNYQQLVNPANTGPSNVVVNTTFSNRNATANRARLALSSTALVPQTVSSTQGLSPLAVNSSASGVGLETQQVLTLGSSSSSTNAFTTAPITVTATAIGTNQITAVSTITLTVGQPVVFASAIGGLISNLTYYVLNIVSNTNFTVSNVMNGQIVSLFSAQANVLMYQSTANLLVNMPIHFHGQTFGGVFPQVTYYVQSIPSTTSFTVSTTPSGTAFSLTTTSGSTMNAIPVNGSTYNGTINNPSGMNVSNIVPATYNSIQGVSVQSSSATGNLLTTQAVFVNQTVAQNVGATPTPAYIICDSTLTLTHMMPVVFSINIGGLVAGTVYYINQIFSSLLFNVSATPGGPTLPLTTSTAGTNYSVMSQATTFLQIGQPIMFNGGGTYNGTTANQAGVGGQLFGGLNANQTYYVASIPSTTTFTVSATPGGSAVTLYNDGMNGTIITAGSFKIGQQYVIVSVGSTTFTGIGAGANTVGTLFIATGAGTGTGTAAVASSAVASSSVTAGVTYAIAYQGSTPASLNTTAGVASNITAFGATTSYGSGFVYGTVGTSGNVVTTLLATSTGGTSSGSYLTPINPIVATTGNLVANAITVASSSATTNTFTSASIAFTNTAAATGYITCANTASLSIGAAIYFDTPMGNIQNNTTYYVLNIINATTFQISATQGGSLFTQVTAAGTGNIYFSTAGLSLNQAVQFTGTTFGGVTSGPIYYISGIFSSNSFQISNIFGGAPISLNTATGTMVTNITPVVPTVNVSASTASGSLTVGGITGTYTNFYTTQYATCSATAGTTPYEITANSTSWMSIGQPVVFSTLNTGSNIFASAAIGSTGLNAGQIYYISSIDSLTSFQVAVTYGGASVVLTSTGQTMYCYQATTNLNIGHPVVFTGTAFGGVTANTTYYISSVLGPAYFTVSTVIYGTNQVLSATTGNMIMQIGPRPVMTVSGTMGSNAFAMQTFTVSATQAGTNLVTVNTTYPFQVGMPIIFNQTTGLMATNQIFFVNSIVNGTQMTVSSYKGGGVFVQNSTTVSGGTLQQCLSPLYLNQPVMFFMTQATTGPIVGPTGLPFGVTLYINTITSLTAFTVSYSPNSSVPGSSASTTITITTGSATANSVAFLPVTNNIVSNFAYQTAPIAVTATTATAPYLITCSSTSGFAVGQPVQFDTAIGGIAINTTYYIASVPSSTTFNISATPFGGAYVTTAASQSVGNVYQSTAGLSVGSAIQFTTSGSYFGLPTDTYKTAINAAYSSLQAGLTFYVQSIPSFNTVVLTLVNASVTPFGASTSATAGGIMGIGMLPLCVGGFTLGAPNTGAQSGSMYLNTLSPVAPLVIGSTNSSGNILSTVSVPVTAVSATNTLITCAYTNLFYPGMPLIFSSGLGNLASGTIYYVLTIPSATTFTVSTTFNGTVFNPGTATGTINVQQSTLFLQPNQPMIFYSTMLGGLTAGVTYYVYEVTSNTTFTIAQYVNNVLTTVTSTTGYMTANTGAYRQLNVLSSSGATFTPATFGWVAQQASNNSTMLFVVNNTFAMYPGMPFSLSGTSGSLTTSTIYYVQSIYDQHRFVASIYPVGSLGYVGAYNSVTYQNSNNTPLTVITTTGTLTLYQSTARLQLNQPVMVYGNVGGQTVASNALVIGRTYVIANAGSETWTTAGAALNTAGTVFTATATTTGGSTGTAWAPVYGANVLFPNQIAYVSSIATTAGNATFNLASTPTYAGINITSYVASVTNANPAVFTVTNYPYTLYVGQAITVTGTASVARLAGNAGQSQTYYITTVVTASTFQVSTTPGGAAITNAAASGTSVAGLTFYLNGIGYGQSLANSNLSNATSAPLGIGTGGGTNAAFTIVPLSSNVTMPNVFQAQPLPIQSTSGASGYTFTTAPLTVAYQTNIGSNTITCLSTAGLTVGMPIVFSASLGPIASVTTYYVLSIPTSTTFTIATSWGGQVLVMYNAYNYTVVQPSTANLSVGQPVTFTGTVFGGIIAYNTYYVATIPSTSTFTLANSLANAIGLNGTPTLIANTAGNGYMLMYGCTGSTTTSGAVVGATSDGAGTAYFGTTNNGLVIGSQYMITSLGTTSWTTYGAASNTVGTIFTATAQGAAYGYTNTNLFNIGAGTGTAIELIGLVGNMNAPIASNAPGVFVGPTITVTGINGTQLYTPGNTGFLTVNQAVVFTGYTFISGITAGQTYYIQSIVNANVFTLSATNGGAVLTFTTGSNTLTMQVLNSTGTSLVPYSTYYTQSVPHPTAFSISTSNTQASPIGIIGNSSTSVIGTANYSVTAVTSTNNLVTSSTGTTGMVVGQAVYFATNLGNLVANTTYYIQSIANATQFTLSTTSTGPALNPGTASSGGTVMNISLVNVTVGTPVQFGGSIAGSGLTAGVTYYIQNINANNVNFSISLTPGGAAINTLSYVYLYSPAYTAFMTFAVVPVTLTTGTNTMQFQSNIVSLGLGSSTQYLLPNQPVTFTNTSGTNWTGLNTFLTVPGTTAPATASAYVVTNTTTTTNVVTLNYVRSDTSANTATTLTTGAFPALTLNQPVVFFGNAAAPSATGLNAGQVYYVTAIASATTISVSTVIGGAAVALNTVSVTAGSLLMVPIYYVKAVTSSNSLMLSATPGGAPVTIPTAYASGTNIVSLTPLPLNTDFIYGDVAVAGQTAVTQSGIIVPPNTYLYTAAGFTVFGTNAPSTLNAIAIGITELA